MSKLVIRVAEYDTIRDYVYWSVHLVIYMSVRKIELQLDFNKTWQAGRYCVSLARTSLQLIFELDLDLSRFRIWSSLDFIFIDQTAR